MLRTTVLTEESREREPALERQLSLPLLPLLLPLPSPFLSPSSFSSEATGVPVSG